MLSGSLKQRGVFIRIKTDFNAPAVNQHGAFNHARLRHHQRNRARFAVGFLLLLGRELAPCGAAFVEQRVQRDLFEAA